MRASWKKTAIGSLAALALGVSTLAAVAPASAQQNSQQWRNHPAGPGPGHGNWHGNGGGHWHNGAWVPAAIGLGILGLAAGAAAAGSEPYYDGPPDDCMQPRPVYDAYGNYMGRRLVNVC